MGYPTHLEAARVVQGCWAAFIVVWLLTALNTKRTRQPWPADQRVIYLLGWVIAVELTIRDLFWTEPRLVPRQGWGPLAACAACLLGTLLCLWARFILGRNWSGRVVLKEDHELIQRGPYRLIRHPIYTGIILMILACALLNGTPGNFLGVALFSLLHVWKSRQEEALLSANFPQTYPAYMSRTKALIPWVF